MHPKRPAPHRINRQIRATQVRVLSPSRSLVGIMPLPEALQLALKNGLDLVEVVATAEPPVCQITDYKKFLYEEKKKQETQSKNQVQHKLKEIHVSPRIDVHDIQTKVNHAKEFLQRGDTVRIFVEFRGRDMEHKEFGFQVLRTFLDSLQEVGKADGNPRLAGRILAVSIRPIKA